MSFLINSSIYKKSGLVFVGGKAATQNFGTSPYDISLSGLSGGVGSSPQTDDIVVVYCGFSGLGDQPAAISTSGYTELAELFGNSGRDSNVSVNYKIMGATPDTVVSVPSSTQATAYGSGAVVHVWRGVSLSNPIDVTTQVATGVDYATADPPSITPVTAGAIILAMYAGTADSSPTAPTAPSGITKFVQAVSTAATSSFGIAIGAYEEWTSGTYDPPVWTGFEVGGTADSWCAATVVLRPA